MYKEPLITATFSSEAVQTRRPWDDMLTKVLKEQTCQPRILYLAKLSFEDTGMVSTAGMAAEIKRTPPRQDRQSF